MLMEILTGLTNLLGPIATLTKDYREQKESALRAISTALDETYLYYRDLRSSPRSLERETMLARYWSAAAIPLRNFDAHLASICDHKSQYWIDPDNYSEAAFAEFNIKLDSVRQAYRKMLRPDFNSRFSKQL